VSLWNSIIHLLDSLVFSAQFVLAFVAPAATPSRAQISVGSKTSDDRCRTNSVDSGDGHTATLSQRHEVGHGQNRRQSFCECGKKKYASVPAIRLSATKAVTVAFWTDHTDLTIRGPCRLTAFSAIRPQPSTSYLTIPEQLCRAFIARRTPRHRGLERKKTPCCTLGA